MMTPATRREAFARSGWTILQAALGVVTVEMFDLPVIYAPIVAAALSQFKSWVASKVGSPDTVTFS